MPAVGSLRFKSRWLRGESSGTSLRMTTAELDAQLAADIANAAADAVAERISEVMVIDVSQVVERQKSQNHPANQSGMKNIS